MNILTHVRTELELDRTKLIAIGVLFLFFGTTSVMLQMFLPEILELSGLEIVGLPDPSIEAIFVDFWGDITIICMIVILFTMSSYSSELDVNKSGYFYLARPISRRTYFLTRFAIRVGGIMLLFSVASLLTYGTATIFFDPLDLGDVMLSMVLLALNVGAVAAVIMLLSSRFSTSVSGGLGFLVVFIQLFLGLIEPVKWLSPFALAGLWQDLIFLGEATDLGLHLLALAGWILVPCLLGLFNYTRRDLI